MDIFNIAAELLKQYTNGVEHCGFIVEDEIIEVPNVAVDPKNHFEIAESDVEQYLELSQATWHSHTHSKANLSTADYQLFANITECHHFIVADGACWVYYTDAQGTVTVEARIDETSHA